jgi:hypothetical protein
LKDIEILRSAEYGCAQDDVGQERRASYITFVEQETTMLIRALTITLSLLLIVTPLARADDAPSWRTLPLVQDGKLAPGWSHIGFGKMTVDGDALRTDCDPRGMGLLVYTKEKLGNCQLRVVFKPEKPNSNAGVYIRIDDGILQTIGKPATAVQRDAAGKLPKEELAKLQAIAEAEEGVWYAVHHGFEVQIADSGDAMHRTGAIYGLARANALPKLRADGWRTMVITLDGPKVFVDVDGQRVTEFDSSKITPPPQRNWTEPKLDKKRPEQGYVGLQNHDPGDVVWFKDVSVRPLGATR